MASSSRERHAEIVPPMIRVFGGIQVVDDGEPVSIGGPRQRRLLALLAVRPGVLADNDWLAENLWLDRDRPDDAAPAIRTAISRLRLALPERARDWIDTEASGYRWSGPATVIEHRWFADMRAAAESAGTEADARRAFDLLSEALSSWRGEPFRELEDLDWAAAEIEQLRMDRLEVIEERWDWALALDRHTEIIGELAAFTAEHGLRDRAIRQHGLALHRSGRSTEALRVLDRHRRLLADESGLEPSVEVGELERAILDGERPVAAEPGLRRIRGYRLLEEAGSGAFAIVWRGYQPSVSREVAIKQIRSELVTQPDFIRRFEAEAQLVARLEHPHIVPLIDFWREPDSAYLVMRWLSGGTLEDRLASGPMSTADTFRLIEQVGGALTAAHAQGVVHNDVSVGNILFDTSGNAYLTDFGIAVDRAGGASVDEGGPEVDVYSLGQVAFDCLTAVQPVTERVVAAIERATSAEPSERFATVADFVSALTAVEPPSERSTSDGSETPDPVPHDEMPVGLEPVLNPYKGLRAFHDADAEDFFGRDALVAELTQQLGTVALPDGTEDPRSRSLIVVGPSGSGKSSVVRAGLMPALRRGAVPGSDRWFATTMVPGAQPFEALETALLRVAVNPPASLVDQLRDGPRGLLRGVRRCLASDDAVLVLLIDQFEELFTAPTDRSLDRPSEDTTSQFLDALTVAVDEPGSPLRLVATLRADYYGQPLQHPAFAPILKRSAVDITPLSPEELERVVVGPAARCSVRFEDGLVSRIVADSIGQLSPLPLLQYALSELFDRRTGNLITVESYESLGGLSGALAARAEDLYQSAGVAEQNAIRRVFGQLLNPDEASADLRRRVAISDLGDEPAVSRLLDRFGKARLLTFDRNMATREPTVEVAHEALLGEWPRLVEWISEDQVLLRALADLGRAATTWDDSGRQQADLYRAGRLQAAVGLAAEANGRLRPVDLAFIEASAGLAEAEEQAEDKRVRRLQLLVAGVGAAAVVAIIAGVVAFTQRNQAREAATEAEVSELLARSAVVREEDPSEGVRLALRAHQLRPGTGTERAVREALISSPLAAKTAQYEPMFDESCEAAWFDRGDEFYVVGGRLTRREATTGLVTYHGVPPVRCVAWWGDETLDRRVAFSDGGRAWFGPFDGDWEVEYNYEGQVECGSPGSGSGCRLNSGNRLLFLTSSDGSFPSEPLLVDDRTGEPIELSIPEGWSTQVTALNGAGTLAALSLQPSFGAGGPDEWLRMSYLKIIDAATGDELFTIDETVATGLAFDDRTNQLIVLTPEGDILTVDIGRQEVVNTVRSGLSVDVGGLQVSDIWIRPDGDLLLMGSDGIEILDRASGPIGSPIPLPRASFGGDFLDDGVIRAYTDDRFIELYDLASNALVDTTIELGGRLVGLEAGTAIVARTDSLDGEEAESLVMIELATEEVIEIGPVPRGYFARLAATVGEDGSIVASTENFRAGIYEIVQWDNGRISDRLRLAGNDGDTGESELPLGEFDVPGPVFDDEADQLVVSVPGGDNGLDVSVIAATATGLELVSTATVDWSQVGNVVADGAGGFNVLNSDLSVQNFDRSGSPVADIEFAEPANADDSVATRGIGRVPARESTSGALAFPTAYGVLTVRPEDGLATWDSTVHQVDGVTFARDGRALIWREGDGSIWLRDLENGESGGLLWQGDGRFNTHISYDAESDGVWFDYGTRLFRIPLDPVAQACKLVGQDSSADETGAAATEVAVSICP